MALNKRNHTVPAGTEAPSRAAILTAFESVNDIVPVANTTARATVATAVGPTTSKPLYVHRADGPVGARLEVTTDGSTWRRYTTDLPYVQIKQDVAQTIPMETWTTITMTGEDLDSDSWHSTSVNTSRVTADRACIVQVSGVVPFEAPPGTSVARVGARINKNGTFLDNSAAFSVIVGSVLGVAARTPSLMVQLASGDYLEMQAFQDFTSTGGGLATRVTADHRPNLSVNCIRLV